MYFDSVTGSRAHGKTTSRSESNSNSREGSLTLFKSDIGDSHTAKVLTSLGRVSERRSAGDAQGPRGQDPAGLGLP